MKRTVITIFMFVLASGLYAYAPNTNEHVRFGTPSKETGTLLKKKGFVVRYSGTTKTPIWISYHLTAKYLNNPLKPLYRFKSDPDIKQASGASLNDYAKSPYARCRMAPLGDMSRSKEVMKECFYLSNVCPMDQQLYKGAWKKLEANIRGFVSTGTDCWVLAGPIYDKGARKKSIGRNKVMVPDGFFKVVIYQAKDGSFKAAGFLFNNEKQEGALSSCVVPVKEIERQTGLKFFDTLPEEVGKIIKGGVYKDADLL